jgi:hypothetical protein
MVGIEFSLSLFRLFMFLVSVHSPRRFCAGKIHSACWVLVITLGLAGGRERRSSRARASSLESRSNRTWCKPVPTRRTSKIQAVLSAHNSSIWSSVRVVVSVLTYHFPEALSVRSPIFNHFAFRQIRMHLIQDVGQ